MRTRVPLSLWTVAALTALSLGAIHNDWLPWLRGPAPYPPEWQWGWRAGGALPSAGALVGALALVALALATFASWAQRRPRASAAALLALACVAGFAFQIALMARPERGALRTLLARTASPSITSYHTVAASEAARDPLAFLREHAVLLPLLADGRKHAATHPPGPVLWYRAWLALADHAPRFREALLAAAGIEGRDTQTTAARIGRAGALAGALALGVLGVLTVWPIAGLAEALGHEPLPAARTAMLWLLLPGPALMTPALDAALALAVTACVTLVLRAAASPWRRLLRLAPLAGLCGAAASFGSYGAATFLAIGCAAALAATGAERWRPALAAGTAAAVVTAAGALGLPALLGHAPLSAMRQALEIHRALFTAPRAYALWLVFDPLDFAMFLGLPLAFAALLAWQSSLRRLLVRTELGALDRYRLVLAFGILVLLLAGVTRGEVGRLWIPLMPFVLVGATGGAAQPKTAALLTLATCLAASTLTIGTSWVL